METNKTDRKILIKGVKIMAFALLSLFMGPFLFHTAKLNETKTLYYPLLIVSILVCTLAVFLLFKGIKTITNSLFKK